MFDMMNILGKAKEAKTKLEAIRANQHTMRITSTSVGGVVTVTVNGDGLLVDLVLDEAKTTLIESEHLADLIVSTTNEAIQTAKAQVQLQIKQETEGLMPNIPGFDIGSMLG